MACLWLINGLPGYGIQVDVNILELPEMLDFIKLGIGHDPTDGNSVVDLLQGRQTYRETARYIIDSQTMWVVFESFCSLMVQDDFVYGRNFLLQLRVKDLSTRKFTHSSQFEYSHLSNAFNHISTGISEFVNTTRTTKLLRLHNKNNTQEYTNE